MGFTDTLKNWLYVQDTPAAVETKVMPPVSIAPAASYPNYRVLNAGSLGTNLGTNTQATNTVFLSILSRIQSAARVVDWKAVWVKADGTEADAPTSPMARILTRPNAEQTWAAFVNQYLTQLLQHGNVFIYCDRVLAPSINAGQAQELRIMPSTTEVIGGQGWRQPVLGYQVPLPSGGYDQFTPDQVVHVKRWQLLDTSPYGLSPVQAAALQLQNLSMATRQRLKQLADGGPNVLLFSKASPELESLTTAQSDALVRKVTGPNKMTYVEGEYGTLQAGLSPVDLDIINSVKLDAGMVADVLNFPAQLLSTSEGNTFANVGEATKALYSDCVLPLLWELMDSLNHKLNDAKYRIQLDTSGVEPLKPNLVPLLTALASADYLSVHQKIDMLGLEKPIGEDVYILTKSAKVVKDLKEAPTSEALEIPTAPSAAPAALATGKNEAAPAA
jgi:HK97 family phage portal protein